MYVFVETAPFWDQADDVWGEDDRYTFISWITEHPDTSDVILAAGGARGALVALRHGQKRWYLA